MNPRVEIIKDIDELNRKVYIFDLINSKLVLDNYRIEHKETKRHKFKAIKHYERLRLRESNISVEDVTLTTEIKDEAIQILISLIEVTKTL